MQILDSEKELVLLAIAGHRHRSAVKVRKLEYRLRTATDRSTNPEYYERIEALLAKHRATLIGLTQILKREAS